MGYMKNKLKGYIGEFKVSRILKRLGKDYKILRDITIDTDYGSNQIDFIVVSLYGIFVIEVKNYTGVIKQRQGAYWDKYDRANKKYSVYSPINQNNSHINVIKYNLGGYRDLKYYKSIIVYNNSVKLSNRIYDNVIYIRNLKKYIKAHKEELLDRGDIDKIVGKLQDINNTSIISKFKHNKEVRNKSKVKREICPKCGNILVERNGKNGKFTGCKGYPECRYTKGA